MIQEITLEEINKLNNPLLIDVREDEEREERHIGGMHIPLGCLEISLNEIDASRPIVVYCRSGARSLRGAKLLKRYFPEAEVYTLANGIG